MGDAPPESEAVTGTAESHAPNAMAVEPVVAVLEPASDAVATDMTAAVRPAELVIAEPVITEPVATVPVSDGPVSDVSGPVAAETTGTSSAAIDPVEVTAESGDATEGTERKKPELNPTFIPSSMTEAAVIAAASMPMTVPSGPVALPPRKLELDAGLEAEINSAMAGATVAEPPATALAPSVAVTVNSEDQLEAGAKLKAKVQSVSADNIFVELGFRSPGLLPAREFPTGKQPNVGEEFLVVVEKFDADQGVVLVHLPKSTRKVKGNWEELSVGQIVECLVTKTNKGGLDVAVGSMRAFLPASQVDLGFIAALDTYVGKKFSVQLTEVNPAKRNIVVSRRAVLITERKEAAGVFWQQVEVGQQYQGTVKTIKDYGAFIDLGGADGFLHVGEMSWSRVRHPSEVLAEGQGVEVVVLQLDREKQKIGLGMRQLAQNPWADAVEKFPVGELVKGAVTRVTDFGAFLQLAPGVEGLVHISELDHRRVKRVEEVVKVGDTIEVKVLEVLPDRQRISLSLKALKVNPEAEQQKAEEAAAAAIPPYERKRKEPLRGGTGGSGNSGLFGNPGSFGGK